MEESSLFYHEGNNVQMDDIKMSFEKKNEKPLIITFDNVLNDKECDELIALSKERLSRSKIGAERQTNTMRTSSGMFFKEDENPLVSEIEKRISIIMGIPNDHAEGLQILHYAPNQEYKAHHDYFSSNSRAAKNNRISTFILYLNDVEAGGETYFPKLDISIAPKKGSAVYFEYFYQNKTWNELTLHGGASVTKGEKWVATQWMRRQRIR